MKTPFHGHKGAAGFRLIVIGSRSCWYFDCVHERKISAWKVLYIPLFFFYYYLNDFTRIVHSKGLSMLLNSLLYNVYFTTRISTFSIYLWSRKSYWPIQYQWICGTPWGFGVNHSKRCPVCWGGGDTWWGKMFIIVIARSNQGLLNAFEHWLWELKLVRGVSLKILGSEAKGNKTKEMNYSSLNWSQCIFFLTSYCLALDPRMKFNKFETGTLSNVTGSCIRPLKCLKNIAFTSKRIEFKLTELNRPNKQLTDEEINSTDKEYNCNLWCIYFNYYYCNYCAMIIIVGLY